MTLLHRIARHGRWCLVAGLLVGVALPNLAEVLRAYLPHLVASLLFLTALRIGPTAAFGRLTQIGSTVTVVLVLQLALPLAATGMFLWFDVLDYPFALAVALMLCAPSVTGTPNFLIMIGQRPDDAMRILVIGTALFPVTALPTLALLPFSDSTVAFEATARLIMVILAATGLGFALRHLFARDLSPDAQKNLDGVAAIALAIIVVGLMSEIGPLLRSDPGTLAIWAACVFFLNFGLQIVAFLVCQRLKPEIAPAVGMIAGNRNIALFLIALPPEVTGPLLIFIGCYQIPMYLTPLLLRRLYAS